MKLILGGPGRVEQELLRRGPAGALALHAGPGKAATARCLWRACGFGLRAWADSGGPGRSTEPPAAPPPQIGLPEDLLNAPAS